MLAYITGTVDQELLLTNEYLAAENRILRAQIEGRLLLSDAEKATLAEIAHRLGQYMEHYHGERNRQGKDKRILFPSPEARGNTGAVRCRERLEGLLKYYEREAA
jgi:hypothetical protein